MPTNVDTGLQRFRHIAIEGPIGVGKSSLARRLGRALGAELLLEQPEENPFLGRFYDDMPGYAFQTQLFFLFQRVKQMQALAQPGMFDAGGRQRLPVREGRAVRAPDAERRRVPPVHADLRAVAPQVPRARPRDLAAGDARHACCSASASAASRWSSAIDDDYLQRLCDAYVEHFHALRRRAGVRGRHRAFQSGRARRRLRAAARAARRFDGPARVLQCRTPTARRLTDPGAVDGPLHCARFTLMTSA